MMIDRTIKAYNDYCETSAILKVFIIFVFTTPNSKSQIINVKKYLLLTVREAMMTFGVTQPCIVLCTTQTWWQRISLIKEEGVINCLEDTYYRNIQVILNT